MSAKPPKQPALSHEETLILIKEAQSGSQEAKDTLFQANAGLIYLVMERFKGSRTEYEDLFQVGSIGLVKAIERFDVSYEVRFSTYAVPMIIGEIKRFLRDDGMVKVQRSLKEVYYRIKWAQDKIRAEMDREPTINEIAEMLGLEKEEIVLAMEACQSPTSIFDLLANQDKDKLRLIDTLRGDFRKDDFVERIALSEALDKLDYREREVIIRRFFKDETQTAIGNDLDISQVQVSRIERSALKNLRTLLGQS
ncbi:MAG: SigB/SigF/SigG family RNA polymerase sigma factor [Syntrophomonadaceae bacterium]|nr:SigB/SigF/SigG family RNA polymerase sigma factor [Syntrophomonadaceae bacterium]